MANGDEILVGLDLDTTPAEKKLKKFPSKARKLGKKGGDNFSSGFKSGLGNFDLVVSNLIARSISSAVSSVKRAVADGVASFRDFSRGIAEINSILPRNAKLTRESANALLQYSTQFGTDPSLQAKAFYNIVSAGIKGTSNQLSVLATSNKAATAGLVNINDSAKLLVSSMNAYSKSGLTSEQASDALFTAVREGQTTFGELSAFMGNVTGVAGGVGIKFTELTGAIAAFTKTGLDTNVAVTGMRQVLVSVVKPTKEAVDEAKRLGLEFSTTALRAKGFAGFLKDVQLRTKGNEGSLSKLFGNVKALTPVLTTLNGNFGEFKRILDETKNSANATNLAVKEIKKSFDFKLKQKSQEFKNFFVIIAQSIEDVFGKKIISVLPNIQELGKSFIFLGRIINDFVIAPAELIVNAFKFAFKKVNEFAAASLAIVGNAAGAIADLLNKFGSDNDFTRGLQTFRESSNEVFQETAADAQESFSKMFDGTVYGKGEEFLAQLETNLTNANQIIKNKGEEGANPGDKLNKDLKGAKGGIVKTSNEIGKAMNNALGQGVAAGIEKVAQALVKGDNIFKAFGQAVLGLIADMAIQMGKVFVATGVAQLALFSTPGASILAGAALITAGTIAKSVFGGGGDAGATAGIGSAGISTGIAGDEGLNRELDPEERAEPETRVSLTIQGDVLDSDETGLRIANILESAQLNQNVRFV